MSDYFREEIPRMSTIDDGYERLDRILSGGEGGNIRSYDRDMASRQPSDISIILTSRSSRISDIGSLLTVTDREIRRAVTIFESDSHYLGEPGSRPRPISANYGGLEAIDAASGSLHLLLTAYGQVLSLLTSKPLQALTAAISVGQGAGSIYVWRHRKNNHSEKRRKKDPLEGINARQALEVLKAFGGDSRRLLEQDMPDLEIEIQRPADQAELFTHPELPEGAEPIRLGPAEMSVVSKSGDIVLRGRRITYIRSYPDGSSDIIYVDG